MVFKVESFLLFRSFPIVSNKVFPTGRKTENSRTLWLCTLVSSVSTGCPGMLEWLFSLSTYTFTTFRDFVFLYDKIVPRRSYSSFPTTGEQPTEYILQCLFVSKFDRDSTVELGSHFTREHISKGWFSPIEERYFYVRAVLMFSCALLSRRTCYNNGCTRRIYKDFT